MSLERDGPSAAGCETVQKTSQLHQGVGFEMGFARHRGCLPPGLSLKKSKITVRYYSAFQPMSSDMEEICWVARVLHLSVKTETHQDMS